MLNYSSAGKYAMGLPKQDSQLLEMRRLFHTTEKHLLEFLEYVPIKKNNLRVISPAIFNMIMESGPQIEPMMAKLIELIKPQQISVDFANCYQYLDQKGMLSIQRVITREESLIFQPFANSNPNWWQAYNKHVKHRLPEGMEKAKLENLLNMYACLFVLHSMANIADLWIDKYPDVPYRLDPDKVIDKVSWIDLQENIAKGTIPTRVNVEGSFKDKAYVRDYREIMHYYTQLNSDVFDYVTVLDPNLFPS